METIHARYEQAACFAALAQAGSFTGAALALGCSKAHVSKQLAALERALGAQLVLRTTRRLSLTEAGQAYLGYCRRLRETLNEGERAVAATHSALGGTVRLTAPPSLGEGLLVDALLEFQARHPRIAVTLDLSVQHRDLLGQELDFAIRTTRRLDPGLVARPLADVADVLVASPELLARHPAAREPADLARVPCLVNPHLRDRGRWLFRKDGALQSVEVGGRLEVNHFGAQLQAALRGAGVARLPEFLVARSLADGRLRRVLPDYPDASTPIYLVYPQRRHLPPRDRAFRDFMLAWFAERSRSRWL
jgi:DNA-binding transcriptional LysR family regulator